MMTGERPSLTGDLAALTASLDGLCTDHNPQALSSALRIAFKKRELYNLYIFSLAADGNRAQALLEVFDKALTAPEHDVKIFKRFRQLCGQTGLLPASHTIPESFIQTTEHPVASGAFGDVWEGIYNDKRVAIKALRVYKHDDVKKVRKVFCKEVVMWKRIVHPNIVPFLGVSGAPAPLSMVSEWMPNGNVRDYVGKNPDTSRLQLLLDISCGLAYLHSLEIVHGDLKGDNILVDKSGRARLNDFGFTGITSLNCTETSAAGFKGSHRWMAPELIKTDDEKKSGLSTYASDVFALGMVTFEIFTGQVPFPEFKTSAVVMKKIVNGERPQRPPKGKKFGLSDKFWEVIQSSSAHKAEERPSVGKFVEFLEKATPDMALLKELTEFDANSEDDIQKLHKMFEYADNALSGMREEETLIVIEVFDRVLNSSLDDSKLRSRCLRGLQKASARCGLLPKSYWIPHSSFAEVDDAFSVTGRISSTCRRSIDRQFVAVKTIDPDCIENSSAFERRLCTNAVIWRRLRHPNVVHFLGFDSSCPAFSLVYPWMPNGNLSDYLSDHPDVNKLDLLLDVARGLSYLHLYNVVHGNLAVHNVLVDSDGYACVSDYGLEVALRGEVSSRSTPTNIRWTAPEVLGTKNRRFPTGDDGKAADVYSFGMVMFEILTGTIPFQNESDEEIVNKVPTGFRPKWPSGKLPRGLAGALWEQIRACWDQEPKERPTISKALETLLVLGETYQQGTVVSLGDPDDEIMIGEWEQVDGFEEALPTHEERKAYDKEQHVLSDLSGSTLVSSLLSGLKSSHHGGSDVHKSGRRRDRLKKHMREFLHLPRHPTTEVVAGCKPAEQPKQGVEELKPGIEEPKLAVEEIKPVVEEEPTPRIEIIDHHEESVKVRDDRVAYLVSRPIPEGKTLKKVVITVVSKDQGWSSYPQDHGTYRNSQTWFELSVGPSKDSEKWCGEVVRNLHAHEDFKEHTVEMVDEELYEKSKSGDVLTVWALARYPGWKNTVKKATIRYVVE